tara:strand:+ start:885 stop:1307 length:423 start_codon:yes stop_codon:yes gene_type:complete
MNKLSKVLEDIINDYKYQLETTEKYDKMIKEIEKINYHSNPVDNCCSFSIYNPEKTEYTDYHIKICKDCNDYYRSNIIYYKNEETISIRYSYYNNIMIDNNNNNNEYIVFYRGNVENWRTVSIKKNFNKNMSCNCLNFII